MVESRAAGGDKDETKRAVADHLAQTLGSDLEVVPTLCQSLRAFPACPLSLTSESALWLSLLTKASLRPNKKAFTRLIRRHSDAVCNAQFTLYDSPSCPL